MCWRGLRTDANVPDTAARPPARSLRLLDIGLPDISGHEVARELRARWGTQAPYLAAVTGWGQATDRERALAAGFDDHILKPMKRATLVEILRLASTRAGCR